MKITIETTIAAPIDDVWRAFNKPEEILQWDASDEWYTTWASNDLSVGGKLLLRIEAMDEAMDEAKDGGMRFDFAATYTQIEPNRLIEFRMGDGNMTRVEFIETHTGVTVRQTFDAETTQSEDHQRADWQSVLGRFARYVESSGD